MVGNDTTPSDCSINKFAVAGKALSVPGVINTDTGIETNAIDTTGDNDARYRRNGIDVFYLRNNQVELNTSGISLSSL